MAGAINPNEMPVTPPAAGPAASDASGPVTAPSNGHSAVVDTAVSKTEAPAAATTTAPQPGAPPATESFGSPLTSSEMDAVLSASGIGTVRASADAQAAGAAIDPAGTPFMPPDIGIAPATMGSEGAAIELLSDVTLEVKVELGRTRMLVEEVLKLTGGSVVELDKLAGDPVDVYVNERLVARGEVLVLNDDFCVRISEVVTPVEERKAG